ncbi:MAG: DNA replication/repair protein RecF [Acidimicrobiaceae bacterium]|nr:DNA replication/repair protein RecF [Acidimicrobiaceae bacterium]MXZ66004.1 DNA replication/repair protein RecF [Acidimicrobiaceae bacterium]MYF31986.1 DNA replication/repair protein RecF [Acidimicrobiaceae bacterium]MYG80073.1 DNA replication/repair protein RecF [Acidimicrobiaceae bacterium]MYJ30092.1 DNA replication/repair protein RecF [Acidimicrobiaceae bacterium]
MRVRSLSLTDFRSYARAEVEFAAGLTAVVGPNGQGKTNLLEAIGFAAGLGSLRGASEAALIRDGAEAAVVRCLAEASDGREVRIEAELARSRPNRVRVNNQPVSRRRDLVGVLTATVFSPEDLDLVKGEPARRRRWIDDALTAVRPSLGALRSEVDRILRQRNTLLRQAGGRASGDVAITLDVWDSRLATAGDELRACRQELLDALEPRIRSHYAQIAKDRSDADTSYVSSWGDDSLAVALAAARPDDLRRATSTVGPHRDDVLLRIGELPARSHASQGEQRSLALALRLAVDAEVRERRDVQPVLLLDDVFSELDADRAAALLDALPRSQRILTTATGLPAGVRSDQLIRLTGGAAQTVVVAEPPLEAPPIDERIQPTRGGAVARAARERSEQERE